MERIEELHVHADRVTLIKWLVIICFILIGTGIAIRIGSYLLPIVVSITLCFVVSIIELLILWMIEVAIYKWEQHHKEKRNS